MWLRDNTMDGLDGKGLGPRNCAVNLPRAMFDHSIKTLADALMHFPHARQGRGLTPIDQKKIIKEVVTREGYRVQLIKNDLPNKTNWVQITY